MENNEDNMQNNIIKVKYFLYNSILLSNVS